MQKFEYEVLTCKESDGDYCWFSTKGKAGSKEQLQAILNAYGRHGWEAAVPAAIGERVSQIVLKRTLSGCP